MKQQINFIINSSRENPLSAEQVLNWLEDNYKLYQNTYIDLSVTQCIQNTLPCFCFTRKTECLFVSIYMYLQQMETYSKYNEVCYLELQKYESLVGINEIKNWIKSNMDFGINKLDRFKNEYSKIDTKHFINGKNENDEYDYLYVFTSLEDFKYTYQFKALFDDLFFEKEILPEALKKYKEEVQKAIDEFEKENSLSYNNLPTSYEFLKTIQNLINKPKY